MSRLFLPLCLLLAACGSPFSKGATRPNLIVLLADDMRWDATGFSGNKIVQTPHLDQLARAGTVFRNTFVTTAICAVSRASLLSGQYARRHGIYDFGTEFTSQAWAECYPELLRQAGYQVGFIGKFGVGNRAPTNSFAYWDGFNGQGRYLAPGSTNHLTRQMGESALRFLREQDGSQPFCLSISFKSPHAQDGARDREFPPDPVDEELYAGVSMPAPATVSDAAFQALPPFLQKSEARTRWERRFTTPEMRDKTIRDYYRLVTGMDREIGRIRNELRKLGLEENTVIVFTSDNGFYLGEHGLAGKWFMHEESIRVPLVIHDPRSAQASKPVQDLALNIDVAPTLLDYAGLTIPAGMQGRSLRPFVAGQAPREWRQAFFYEHHFPYGGRIPDSEGVRTSRWKYVRYTGQNPPVEQLFDLLEDPLETRDLAPSRDYSEKLAELRSQWLGFQNQLK